MENLHGANFFRFTYIKNLSADLNPISEDRFLILSWLSLLFSIFYLILFTLKPRRNLSLSALFLPFFYLDFSPKISEKLEIPPIPEIENILVDFTEVSHFFLDRSYISCHTLFMLERANLRNLGEI